MQGLGNRQLAPPVDIHENPSSAKDRELYLLGLSNMMVKVSAVSSAFSVTVSSFPAHFKILEMLAIDKPRDKLRSHL